METNEATKKEYEYRRTLVQVGSIVTSKKNIRFTDGTYHIPGKRIVVTEDSISYFVVNLQDYKVLYY
jgi:hypothetical protein